MKKPYQRPQVFVEQFELTQRIASCGGIKISFNNSGCVLSDSDATNEMRDLAQVGFFTGYENGCLMVATDGNGVCFHTNVNMAWSS